MNALKNLHRQAMEQTDLALAARLLGDQAQASLYFHEAYNLEAKAAMALVNDYGTEPTRSVLFRSAATLALDCELNAEAEKLVCLALSGNPPDEVAEELRDLLEQIHFQRHLSVRGIALNPDEVQMSIAGKSVGYGIAPTDAFLSRVESLTKLLYRTGERKQQRLYRDRGRRDQATNDNLQLFMTVPRAASFAVTFRVGGSDQLELPGVPSIGEQVIDELINCLDLYTQGEETQLKDRINEEAYYRNFVSLTETIQPDGDRVNVVGLTTFRKGAPKKVSLRTRSKPGAASRPVDPVSPTSPRKRSEPDPVEVSGVLKMADSTRKTDEIQIVADGGARHIIVVPVGMMSDIVKPLWGTEVEVLGVQKGRKIHLMQIRPRE